jgi:hypothetical protein
VVAKGKRAEAKAAGLTYYFTGQSCKRGHVAKRITANGCCHRCFLEDKRRKRSSKPGYRTRAEMDAERTKSLRKCSGPCGREYPATIKFFVLLRKQQPSGTLTIGLSRECRECRNRRYKPFYETHRSQIIERATLSTRKRRERQEVREQERISSRNRMRIILTDPNAREQHNARGREWRAANPDRAKQFKHEQPAMKAHRAMMRRAQQLRAMPPWADKRMIETVYAIKYFLIEKTGIPYEVDHYYPLTHPRCCGLHVHWNLRVITEEENQRKGNRLPEQQWRKP